MKRFTGMFALIGFDLLAFLMLIYFWATSGFDGLRDGLIIIIFGGLNIVIFLTQRKTIRRNNQPPRRMKPPDVHN